MSLISSVQTSSMVHSDYVKHRILFYCRLGKSYADVSLYLSEEEHKASKMGVYKFLKRYQETGTISRRSGSGQASKISPKAKHIIDQQMTKDDESTGMELQKILAEDGIVVSARTALRWRNQLGWTSKGTSYCQMMRRKKRETTAWAPERKGLSFEDVVYMDETTVQIETTENVLL